MYAIAINVYNSMHSSYAAADMLRALSHFMYLPVLQYTYGGKLVIRLLNFASGQSYDV